MKDVGGTTVITTIKEETKWLKRAKMQEALKKVDATKAYSVEEAVALAKDTTSRNLTQQLKLLTN